MEFTDLISEMCKLDKGKDEAGYKQMEEILNRLCEFMAKEPHAYHLVMRRMAYHAEPLRGSND